MTLLLVLCLAQDVPAPTAETTRAIDAGLAWLAKRQLKDGSVPYLKDGSAIASTALAGLAWLGASDDCRPSPHQAAIKPCLTYVLDNLGKATFRKDWKDVNPSNLDLHAHGFALLFLATAWDRRAALLDADAPKELVDSWRAAIAAAVKLSMGAQLKNGGWGYAPGDTADSITPAAVQFAALQACVRAGFEVDGQALRRAIAYADSLTSEKAITRYGSSSKEADTSSGVSACGAVILAADGAAPDSKADRALGVVLEFMNGKRTPAAGHAEFCSFLGLTALSQAAGARWAAAWPLESRRLVKLQSRDGSWGTTDAVICTTLAVLALELPLRSLPFTLSEAESAAVRSWRSIDSAASLTVSFKAGTLKGTFQSKGRDRWRLDLEMEKGGNTVEVRYRCDGKQFSVWNQGAWTAPEAVMDGMTDYFRRVSTRGGFAFMLGSLPQLARQGERLERFPAAEEVFSFSGFLREADILSFDLIRRRPAGTFRQRLWIDKTGMPAKRVVTNTGEGEKAAEITEIYEKVSMDDLPDARFELEK